jgi:hypothetical protein
MLPKILLPSTGELPEAKIPEKGQIEYKVEVMYFTGTYIYDLPMYEKPTYKDYIKSIYEKKKRGKKSPKSRKK